MLGTIKSYFEEAVVKNIVLKDEIGTVFGSYGWSGEAPKLVIEILKNRFGVKFTNYRSWSNVHQINLVSRSMLRWVIELPKALFIESDMC